MTSDDNNKPSSPQDPDKVPQAPDSPPQPSKRLDYKSMRQPMTPSQRYGERISVRPGGHVSLRPQSGTLRPEGTSGTMRPDVSPSQVAPSVRPSASMRGESPAYHAPIADTSFEIDGTVYEREALLSSTTGEAEILLVRHGDEQYVLKLYYRGYYPSTEVLQTLKDNGGKGLLVDILAFGLWTSQSGEERFGVLMPYYSGGVLKGGEFRGKADQLEEVAKQAMASLKYCHELGILHKDIKPNNFIYTDQSRRHIVLADFGIASVFHRDIKGNVIPFVNVNQNRTYIYASPEIFNLTVQRSDGKVEVEYSDVKSDFFALGMSLLVLWMGEAPFALLDERSLLKLKRGERSGLPYPEDIPAHTRNLIRGLTIADPKMRWGQHEYEQWLRGEDQIVESVRNTGPKGLHILYNGSKNQIATSLRQLAQYMLDDPALGEQYLYSGKISKWMADAGLPEWQMRIDSIVNKQYPKSRRSGLLAACYKMNPELPFVGIKGDKCFNQLQLARELTRHADEYSMALRDWDAPLYVYFASHGMDIGTKYQPLFKSNPWVALWRLAYAISPECEFPFWSTTRNAIVWCSTIDDLVEEYAASSQDRYSAFGVRTPIGKYTPMLLTDECFITWLGARDADLAERVSTALDSEKSQGSEIYYYIFYLLAPDRNFFYERTDESFYTLAQMGSLINRDMIDYLVIGRHNNNQHFYNEQHRRCEQLSHYRDTKMYYYFRSRGYDQSFEYIDRCFDLHSKENRAKTGPYSAKLATIKVCHAFAGESFYYFPASDITVTDLEQLSEVPVDELREELRRGFLLEWLAVQYQESPSLPEDDKDAYNREVLKFMDRLASIDPESNVVVRYRNSLAQVQENSAALHQGISRVVRLKRVLLAFAAVVAVMAVFLLIGGVHSLPNDDAFSYNWRTMAYVALPLFVLMCVPPIQSVVTKVSKGFLSSPLLFAIVVSNVIVVGWEVLRLYIMPYAHFTVPAIFCIFLAAIIYSAYGKRRLRRSRYSACINPDFDTMYIEPLTYAWRDINDPYKEFDSSVMRDTREYASYLKDITRRLRTSIRIYAIWLVILVAAFCLLSKPVSRVVADVFPGLRGEAVHEMQKYDDPSKVTPYICDVDNALSVRESPKEAAKVVGTLNDGEVVEVVDFEGDYAKILYDGSVAYVLRRYLTPL